MEDKKYKIGNKEFETKEEYIAVVSDLKKIKTIKEKYDIKEPEQARKILEMLSKNPQIFQTSYGNSFINELKKVIEVSDSSTKEEKPINQELKVCKYCKAQIPKQSVVCPNCKMNLNRKNKWIVATVVCAAVAIGVCAGYFGNNTEKNQQKVNKVKEKDNSNVYSDRKEEIPQTIDGFDKAEYNKYNSYASENGLNGKLIYIEGKVISQTKIGDSSPPVLAIVVEQKDGKRWCVLLNSDFEIEEVEEKNVRVFGLYQGYSDVMNLPSMAIAVEDENIMNKARMEVNEDGKWIEAWNFYKDYVKAEIDKLNNSDNYSLESEGTESENKEEMKLEDFQETEPFFSYSGTGDDIVSGAKTESSSYAHIIHTGDGHFSVKGHYGNRYDLLVNTTKPYDGTTLILPNQEYKFEVSARGDWTIELYKIGTSSSDSFSGNGDCITPVFLKTSDVYEITTSGTGHFSIKGWGNNGYDLLVNTTDE